MESGTQTDNLGAVVEKSLINPAYGQGGGGMDGPACTRIGLPFSTHTHAASTVVTTTCYTSRRRPAAGGIQPQDYVVYALPSRPSMMSVPELSTLSRTFPTTHLSLWESNMLT